LPSCGRSAALFEAAIIAGYERGGKIIERGNRVGFAVGYYPEKQADFGASIVGALPPDKTRG